MRPPYRVGVWGPGDLGAACIRECARLPEIELVGAYCYSAAKDGADLGTIAGTRQLGVRTTRDLDAFLALDVDVVIYTALDQLGDPVESPLRDFEILLAAGKNVITSQPFNWLPSRGEDFASRLGAAAARGGSTFFAGGIDPGFIVERWALTMTSLCNDVRQIKIGEYFDCRRQKNDTALRMIGLGSDPSTAMDENSPALMFQRHYYPQLFQILADAVGVEISRVGVQSRSQAAPEDLHAPPMDIKQGKTGRVAYEWTGYVGEAPFFVLELVWYLTPTMRPTGVESDDHWAVQIEARPSVRSTIDLRASFSSREATIDDEPAAVGFVSTAICLIQPIPYVVAAEPGIAEQALPAVHWKADMRAAVGST
jgi:4-hydroxy-tetrahydrodipicolinate reductase